MQVLPHGPDLLKPCVQQRRLVERKRRWDLLGMTSWARKYQVPLGEGVPQGRLGPQSAVWVVEFTALSSSVGEGHGQRSDQPPACQW